MKLNFEKKYYIIISLIIFTLIIIYFFYYFYYFKKDKITLLQNQTFNQKVQQRENFSNNIQDNLEKLNLKRNWQVLDPQINAESILIETIDNKQPIFYFNSYKKWPIASLTKLLTAVVLLENLDNLNEKIEIDKFALSAYGTNGNLKLGEIYNAIDLLKIMIISSSNDAAVAFEQFLGKDNLINLINKKIKELKMEQTIIYDSSGLDEKNVSTANDLNILLRYILLNHPEILNWTRLPNLLVQPSNKNYTNNVLNINPFINYNNFWGGKTGTNDKAKQNFIGIFTIKNQRFIIIILGATDREKEVKNLLNWVKTAYNLN
ncbi:MAG: serine hydrolase [Candidatus Pacearchaeota archaeon]